MIQALYLPSTPLNVLVSAALANQFREQHQAQIWLIDQKHLANNPYVKALENWRDSPFEQVKILPGLAKGLQHKLIERKDNFERLQLGLQTFHPDIVAVGSDRRIEFQYVMHQLKKSKHPAKGWYLDDGLYSYAGRPYHPIKDGINRWLKKLSYGFWWDEPKTVGASHWIHQAWLFQPQQAYALLKTKQIEKLSSDWFSNENVQKFSRLVTEQFEFDGSRLADVDVVLIIPHPNNQKKMQGYQQRIHGFVDQLIAQGKRIALKYHPREKGEDALGLVKSDQVTLIPTTLAFEFVLPLLPSGATVIGDVGTVLLTTKWLREDLKPIAVLNLQDSFQQSFASTLESFSIQISENLSLDKTMNEQINT